MDKLVLSAFQKIKEVFVPPSTKAATPETSKASSPEKPIKDEFITAEASSQETKAQETKQDSGFFTNIINGITNVGKFLVNPIASVSNYLSSNFSSGASKTSSGGILSDISSGISSLWNNAKSYLSGIFTGGNDRQNSAQVIALEAERERRREEEKQLACQEREYRSSPATEPSKSDTKTPEPSQSSEDVKKATASSALMKHLIGKYGHILQGFEIGPLTTENQLISFLIRSKRLSSDEMISILEKKGLNLSGVFDALHRNGLDHKFSEAAQIGLANGSTISAVNFATELGKSHKAIRSEPITGNSLRFIA